MNPAYFGEVAKLYRYKDTNVNVGFISSVSESFCSSCTRARLSANGQIFTCLFNGNGHDLRNIMRNGATDEELTKRISEIWNGRDDRYSDERMAESIRSGKKLKCLISVDNKKQPAFTSSRLFFLLIYMARE